jgi:hypothetical protein
MHALHPSQNACPTFNCIFTGTHFTGRNVPYQKVPYMSNEQCLLKNVISFPMREQNLVANAFGIFDAFASALGMAHAGYEFPSKK